MPNITLDTIRDLKIYQHEDGYRFSMDAVFLADFVKMKVINQAADFGAGSGVVGLMLAKRFELAKVTLVELQPSLYKLCNRNIKANGLEAKVSALCADLRGFETLEGLDLVVSNPPFRKPASGRISEGQEKSIARHELELTLKELVFSASLALRTRGKFCMVYHPERIVEVFDELRSVKLEPKRIRFIHGRTHMEAKMVLIEAVKNAKVALKTEPPLFVYKGKRGQEFTDEVNAIYGVK